MEKKSLFEQLTAHKVILYMLGFLLFLLNLFMLSIMPGLLYPLRAIMSIVGPPLVIATIFFYLFNPVITWLQKRGIARSMGVLILFLAILGIIVISVLYVFPIIQHQVESIIVVLPRYFNELIEIIDPLIQTSDFREMYQQIQDSNIVQTITEQGTNVLNATLSGVGSFVNIITQAVFIIFTVPFILYFLLVSPEKVPNNIIRVVPTRWRQSISSFLTSVHEQLSIYVRGQLMVAFFCGVVLFSRICDYWIRLLHCFSDYWRSFEFSSVFRLNYRNAVSTYYRIFPSADNGCVCANCDFIRITS